MSPRIKQAATADKLRQRVKDCLNAAQEAERKGDVWTMLQQLRGALAAAEALNSGQ